MISGKANPQLINNFASIEHLKAGDLAIHPDLAGSEARASLGVGAVTDHGHRGLARHQLANRLVIVTGDQAPTRANPREQPLESTNYCREIRIDVRMVVFHRSEDHVVRQVVIELGTLSQKAVSYSSPSSTKERPASVPVT